MKHQIVLNFESDEADALRELSLQELRGEEEEIMYLIRRELARRGFLKVAKTVTEAGTRKVYQVIED